MAERQRRGQTEERTWPCNLGQRCTSGWEQSKQAEREEKNPSESIRCRLVDLGNQNLYLQEFCGIVWRILDFGMVWYVVSSQSYLFRTLGALTNNWVISKNLEKEKVQVH